MRTMTTKCENCGKDFEAVCTADVENGPSIHDAEGGQTTCDSCMVAAQEAWDRELHEVWFAASRRFMAGEITASKRDEIVDNYMRGV